jgi:ribosomal protein S18 acetylase RimI-like enzyme
MTAADEYLAAYDVQLRTDAETPSAIEVERLGPLRLVRFAGGRGFITYRDLGGADAAEIAGLVEQALAHYRDNPSIWRVEWKTRGHDRAPGLHEALVGNGFVPDPPESIMIGEARLLALDVPLPDGVELRRVSSEEDVRAMCAMQDEVFGDRGGEGVAVGMLRRLSFDDGMELWVAEAAGEVVCAGRLEPVAGTEFAGIWGGATRPQWRRRGIYRALTAARARSAVRLGKRLLHSDSSEYSRPILERAGMVKVSTTTPYFWQRREGSPGGDNPVDQTRLEGSDGEQG